MNVFVILGALVVAVVLVAALFGGGDSEQEYAARRDEADRRRREVEEAARARRAFGSVWVTLSGQFEQMAAALQTAVGSLAKLVHVPPQLVQAENVDREPIKPRGLS